MSVRLEIPGNPKPLERPRMAENKKTHQRFWFTPQTCLFYQQLVRVAALQRKDEIDEMRSKDVYGRIFIKAHFVFRNHRHPDPTNVLANVMDGLGRALGSNKQTADKVFCGHFTFDVIAGITEGETLITILPYSQASFSTPPADAASPAMRQEPLV